MSLFDWTGARIANIDEPPRSPPLAVDKMFEIFNAIGAKNEKAAAQRAAVDRLIDKVFVHPPPETITVSRADYDALLAGAQPPAAGWTLQVMGIPVRVEKQP